VSGDVKGVITRPDGANCAILLVHGFAASSDELATLGQYLAEKGYASFAVQLAGHGTTPENFKTTSWQDWYESARKGLEVVKSWKPDFTFIAGLSMGGLLSILLASEENEIDGMALIGTALKVPGILPKFLPVLKYFLKWREVDIEQAQLVYDVKRFKYDREPITAYQELFSLQKVAKKRLSAVSIPTIVLHGTEDKTIDPISGQIAYDNISSEEKELHMIEGAEHVISCHPTRTEAYPLILKFIERIVK
jgi:carboxylesterase